MLELEIQKSILFCFNKNHNWEHEVLCEVVVKMNRSNSNHTLEPNQSHGANGIGI